MNSQSQSRPINEMTFEEALKEMETIVRTLETGGMDLEKSIHYYERGTALKSHCESRLKEAKLKVEKITAQKEDGSITTESFDKNL